MILIGFVIFYYGWSIVGAVYQLFLQCIKCWHFFVGFTQCHKPPIGDGSTTLSLAKHGRFIPGFTTLHAFEGTTWLFSKFPDLLTNPTQVMSTYPLVIQQFATENPQVSSDLPIKRVIFSIQVVVIRWISILHGIYSSFELHVQYSSDDFRCGKPMISLGKWSTKIVAFQIYVTLQNNNQWHVCMYIIKYKYKYIYIYINFIYCIKQREGTKG